MIARQLFQIRTVDARQMAAGLWSVMPDVPKAIRTRWQAVAA
jgi:hypothetical protein